MTRVYRKWKTPPADLLIAIYSIGVDDGFYFGTSAIDDYDDERQRDVYRRGYDHGVRLFCDTIDDGIFGSKRSA